MKHKAKIYIKDKLLKIISGTSQKGGFVVNFYVRPKNFQKEIDEAEQAVAKQKSKKKKILSIGFFILNLLIIGGILGYQFSQSEDMSITALINGGFSGGLLILLFFSWVVMMFLDSYRYQVLIKRSSGRFRPFLSYKVAALGKYYDNITPMSTGGQPFQIFYLTHRGLNASASISVPMGRYVVNQIIILVIWTIALIISFCVELGEAFAYVKVLCITGYILNAILIVGVVFLSINEKTGKKLVIWTLKLLQKIKIVKNFEKQYNRVVKVVTDFQATIRNLAKRWKTFVMLILTSFLYNILMYSLPFFVYSAIVGNLNFALWPYIVLLGILIDMGSSFVPLPGGSGASELSFAALFAVIISNNAQLTWALIIWKFMSYYIYLIQGLLVLCYDNFFGNKRYKWLKRKWELERESMNFRQDKLHEFQQNKKHKRSIF